MLQPARCKAHQACGLVLRGGSWNNNPDHAAASFRNRNNPDNINNNNGFRVVVSSSTHFRPFSGIARH